MSWAWDMFCPKCCATLVGGMGSGDKEAEVSQAEYDGSIIYCNNCNIYIDFTSGDIIDLVPFLYHQFNKYGAIHEIKIINGG